MSLPDHPDIASAERTGYPTFAHKVEFRRCKLCGEPFYQGDLVFSANCNIFCGFCFCEEVSTMDALQICRADFDYETEE